MRNKILKIKEILKMNLENSPFYIPDANYWHKKSEIFEELNKPEEIIKKEKKEKIIKEKAEYIIKRHIKESVKRGEYSTTLRANGLALELIDHYEATQVIFYIMNNLDSLRKHSYKCKVVYDDDVQEYKIIISW